jgi:hypothetical protein
VTQFGKRLAPAAQSTTLMPQSFPARFLLAEGDERHCEVAAIDPDSALFLCAEQIAEGTALVAYIEEIGRVDGTAGEADDMGFWVNFSFAPGRQPRFVRHLRWLIRRERGLAAAERRHTRYEPRNKQARFTLAGGREQPCEVIDISLSGAGLRSRIKPSLGSPVTLGRMKARVVRHLEDGFAIEFLTPLERSDLDSALS